MKILIIGGGGREHALAWKCAQSPDVETVFVAPGNAGTALEPGVENVAIDVLDLDRLVDFAKQESVDLTIVGPEAPLVQGVVDRFQEQNLNCFGPSKGAAQLEGSKVFTKDFLARHSIPTAAYQTFTDVGPAMDYIQEQGVPIVVKADGLAAGKGVVVAQTEAEAVAAVKDMLSGNVYGEAGHRVVIEEFLVGEEASFIVMVDGKTILPLATSQDHKARDDGDQGPNTGGMGAYSPAPVVTDDIHARVMSEVIEPTVKAMAQEGNEYTGFLYAGLMVAPDGSCKVLEYNCRFGDPETQPIIMRLRSDLPKMCLAAVRRELHLINVDWDPRAALGVVMAAGGYPGAYDKGKEIKGLQTKQDAAKVFHAGTQLSDGDKVVTSGGRVLCVTALGSTVLEAQQQAYKLAKCLNWADAFYRHDIGYRAVARELEDQ